MAPNQGSRSWSRGLVWGSRSFHPSYCNFRSPLKKNHLKYWFPTLLCASTSCSGWLRRPAAGCRAGTLPRGGPTRAATCLSVGAGATNLYTGLINEPSHSSPESHSLRSRPGHRQTVTRGWMGRAGSSRGVAGTSLVPAAAPSLPARTWAGVESLFQAQVWSRLSPAPCKPYQDIQALVLMAGKVAVCLLDSYHREGGKNNGLLPFPCRGTQRLKRIFMCCCRPRILWPDPALSCAAARRTRVAPGLGSASRWENGTLLPESGPNGFFWKCQNPPGRLSLRQGTPGTAAPGLGPPGRLAPLSYLLFFAVSSPLTPHKALPSAAFRHVRKKSK